MNTMHQVADAVEAAIDVPFLHLVGATAARIRETGLRRVGLLGTRYTMEMPFYAERMAERRGIEILVPDGPGRTVVHDVIYRELTQNRVLDSSRAAYVEVVEGLAARGAEAVVLGCTEITLLISPGDSPLPGFDSTRIHVEAALDAVPG